MLQVYTKLFYIWYKPIVIISVLCSNFDPTKYYKIVNVRSQLPLGVVNSSLAENGIIWQEYDNGSDAQLWKIQLLNVVNQTYKFINRNSGMAFTSPPTFGTSYQTTINSTRTDQIFQIYVCLNGCCIKPYPFVSYYLTINYCMITPTQAESCVYVENQNGWVNCQQFIFQEPSKLYFNYICCVLCYCITYTIYLNCMCF